MQNFGRGMWRRVGDYERLHKPVLLEQSRVEQLQYFAQHQAMLKNQQTLLKQSIEQPQNEQPQNEQPQN